MKINPKYLLRQPKAESPTAIVLQLFIGGHRFKWSTRQKIHPDLWDGSTQRPLSTKSKTESERSKARRVIKKHQVVNPKIKAELENIDARLDHIISFLQEHISNSTQGNNKLDLTNLRDVLELEYGVHKTETQRNKDVNLNSFIATFVVGIESGEIVIDSGRRKSHRYATSTIKSYKEFKVQFDQYQKHNRKRINFDDCTVDLYNNFVLYFQRKGYTDNSIGKQIKHLKSLLRRSREEGLHSNSEWERKAIKVLKGESLSIYLEQGELDALEQLDLDKQPTLDKIRDVFLIGCYTALRYSDYSRIKAEHIKSTDGINVIDIITRKENQRVIIPLRPELARLLSKYNYEVPKTHEQKVNKHIKEIGRLASIDTMIEIEATRGGLKIKRTIPKYELIKTHSARRTAVSLMYKAGIPSIDIMKITGHTTESNFLKYVKVTKEETALRLSKHPFFNQMQVSND